MKKLLFIIVLFVSFILHSKAQLVIDSFIGAYHATLIQHDAGTYSYFYNRTIYVDPASQNDYFIGDDGGSTGYHSSVFKLQNDSTFYDTLGASSTCRYGNFHNTDSLYIYLCGLSGRWSKYYGKKISGIGLQNLNANDKLSLFPNPAINKLNIIFPDEKESLQLSIYDISGKEVLEKQFTKNLCLDVGILPRGVYIVRVRGKDVNINRRIVLIE